MEVTDSHSAEPQNRQHFRTTRWSVVLAARGGESRPALAALCEGYWYPLYAYVRHRGYDAEQARDLTQEFFATLLEKDYLQGVDPERGRFRTFLLVVLQRFLAKDFRASRAAKRGGGRPTVSLDFALGEQQYANEPVTEVTAEQIFERRWALTILERVVGTLQQEYQAKGKEGLFGRLSSCLTAELDSASYDVLGEELGMTAGAVKTAAFRFRQRYRELLREEVALTVAQGDDVDEELCYLREVVSRS